MAPPNCLLAVLALAIFLGASNGLPITSRPIEGNVQRMVWDDWVNLDPEQRSLTKEKKVTAKSIFTLPFRHCPQGHTLYNELCIPQSNIDPTDLIKQELILAGGTNGNSPPPPIADYDYGDDAESEEIVYDLSVIPTAMQDSLPPRDGVEGQALPSEDAPLKFNIFEKKFPTGTGEPEEPPMPPDVLASISAGNSSFTAATSASTAATSTTTVSTPAAPSGDASNRIGGGDLLAAPSDALSTSATFNLPSGNSSTSTSTANGDIGQVEAIVLPAGQAQDGDVHLVTSSLIDSENSSTAAHTFNAGADLDQLLKADAFLPAHDGGIELLPPLASHRKVSPPLSADQDAKIEQTDETTEPEGVGTELTEEEGTTTDPVTGEEEEYTTETETTAGGTTVSTEVSMDSAPAPSILGLTAPHPPEEPELDEGENRLVLIKSKVQPVQSTTTTSATAASTATTAADVADLSSSTDRFHYQHFVEYLAASSTTATAEPSSSTVGELIDQNDMPATSDNDNLMTNTIAGHAGVDDDGGHKATGEMDAQQELRLINELVRGKQREQQQQQQQQLEPTSTEGTSTPTEEATVTTAANWSKVIPQLGQGTSEAATSTQANESSSTAKSAAAEQLSITNRSNRNSKIIRVGQVAEEPAATAATAESPTSPASPTSPSSSSNPDGYTPFWWLPSIGWRLERQVDGNGEDHSLLLRFFSTFRGSGPAATTR
ncbi:protein folded gastrulation [Drosophila biarmipes]|uniref:protein folded gastrulation n=1 Tax=Drosophila biarmipes TaxID=125945 RepID=UPI0007E6B0BB|nr:protein folded gastrulation [Drosophila biarmipes]XP_043949623.1 protein folded gastrulation [Drosophila biarmipes]XP_043949624.1 protein folded gastrulation [Drosophila biarmipes]XP_043949625.1 protein folded gastrulation [Drosophila biarmipes]XP_043949626.1 protein folded gastrulation [Drosophila biarmipes]XP_043949627.1 protein folded gastrulation [Drosophila biarmipes]